MKIIAALFVGAIGLLLVNPLSVHAQSISPIVISELQTGGCDEPVPAPVCTEDGTMEFIELHNTSNEPVLVTGWRLEYVSASQPANASATRLLLELQGYIEPSGFALFSYWGYIPQADGYFGKGSSAASGLLAKTGGHVRLVSPGNEIYDLVSWGSAKQFEQWWRSSVIPAGYSISRILPDDVDYNPELSTAFTAPTLPSPTAGGLTDAQQDDVAPQLCDGVILSEILPNPDGADAGKEFIEIYNPTSEPISLNGCVIRLGDNGKQFALPDEMLSAGGYRAFYDSETKLVLPNGTGTTVWLITHSQEQGVRYPDGMGADKSWAYINGIWQETSKLTPGKPNELLLATATVGGSGAGLAPCGPGKERNPATNRCRAIAVSPQLTPCKPGQERNPQTNRCRAITSASTALVPCKPGQERNPATNRCRSLTSADTTLKPCGPGQERNPETNRCRKVASSPLGQVASVQDVYTPQGYNSFGWWLAGIGVLGAVVYGVYEWRHSIAKGARRLMGKS